MRPTPVKRIITALGFEVPDYALPNAERLVSRITWDSRTVDSNSVFVAIPGERVDGNDYIVPAIGAGAQLVLASRRPDDATLAIAAEFEVAIVFVDDARQALGVLAGAYRDTLNAYVVGITGSSGKTTTKDLIVSVLSQILSTHGTKANHNNELGVPATVLSAAEDTQALVVEMGMRGAGQIEHLCSFVKPYMGVITNVGVSHIELLGSQRNIALAKGELVRSLPDNGYAVLCGDDPWTPFIIEQCAAESGCKVVTYGFAESCDVRGSELTLDSEGRPSFTVRYPNGTTSQVRLRIAGRHNATNALAAAAVGYHLGIAPALIARGLEQAVSSGMRMEIVHAADDVTIINDAYNANPESMRVALETLAAMEVRGRRVAVLGDMGELGADSMRFHRQAGEQVQAAGVDELICVGKLSRNIATAAIRAGLDPAHCRCVDDAAQAIGAARQVIMPGDTVLVKASHAVGLERVVEGLGE